MNKKNGFTLIKILVVLLTILPALPMQNANVTFAAGQSGKPASKLSAAASFSFAGIGYLHRFSQGDQHEYTPQRQDDLKAWTDMMTVIHYRNAKDEKALAATANAVLENYKSNKAKIIKTDSVPKTKDRPAEHLIIAVFVRAEFIEAVFARFKMQGRVGVAAIYSHRIYGKQAGNAMSAWLKKSGPSTEKSLMNWKAMPKPSAK